LEAVLEGIRRARAKPEVTDRVDQNSRNSWAVEKKVSNRGRSGTDENKREPRRRWQNRG